MAVSHGWSQLVHRDFGGAGHHASACLMTRFAIGVIAGVLLLACHSAPAANWDTGSGELPAHLEWRADNRPYTPPLLGNQPMRPLNPGFALAPPWAGGLTLSPTEQRVSLIAYRYGDRSYLMVDKSHGKIILFENGTPILIRPALTGESMADRIPAAAWSTPWSRQGGVEFKVTPAGRFTITRDYDRGLGELFDVDKLRGRDWAIAIHRVWLGRPAERRDARLLSGEDQDKHITNGCIDVDPGTMAQLSRVLPSRGMPLYILPNDENLIGNVFQTAVGRTAPRS